MLAIGPIIAFITGIPALLQLVPGYGIISGIGSVAVSIAKKIPLKVWLAIGAVVFVLAYGQWRHHEGVKEGRAQVTAQVVVAARKEVARQTAAKDVILERERKRADTATANEAALKEKLDAAIRNAQNAPDAGGAGLSRDGLKRLRSIR